MAHKEASQEVAHKAASLCGLSTELERWREQALQMLAPAEVTHVPGSGATQSR